MTGLGQLFFVKHGLDPEKCHPGSHPEFYSSQGQPIAFKEGDYYLPAGDRIRTIDRRNMKFIRNGHAENPAAPGQPNNAVYRPGAMRTGANMRTPGARTRR